MIDSDLDITPLTVHPAWPRLARYVRELERAAVDRLRTSLDPVANQQLIFLAHLKAGLRNRSENKEMWNA